MMDDHTRPDGAGDEPELRTLLHAAVAGLEPSAGSLDRLRTAVPARRARKRRALVGAAAAALLACTALPAALHLGVTGGDGSVSDHSAMAGHGEEAATGTGAGGHGHDHRGTGHAPRQSKDADAVPGHHGGTEAGSDPTAAGSPSGGGTAGPSAAGGPGGATGVPGGPMPPVPSPAAPGCSADQLGVQASARAPEADGKVYGSFTVTNVSARGCSVAGPDTVTAASVSPSASGGATGVTVVGHTAGDAAPGLPDPSVEAPSLVLQPYAAYEVRFAWVPSGMSCPAATTDPAAKPPAGGAPQEQPPADGTAAADPAERTDGPAADTTGVAVSHTPATAVPGAPAPTTRTTIPAACGGTLYRTGVIPLDAAQKP
ncbi:hypothetical protein [Streptomyces sp. NPDC007369]|uniref:hypothetical protein n=1 Tax=Streptomyces sp. NPDC007369 TaxID=3154589 RepID=UPI0033D51DF2